MRKLVFIDLKHYLCEPLGRQSKTQNHHSEPLVKESLTKLARDISLAQYNYKGSHSILRYGICQCRF